MKFYFPEELRPGFTESDWISCQEYFNQRLEKLLQPYENFAFMRNNLKTAWSADGEISLLPDGSHKLPGVFGRVYEKDVPTMRISDSLFADSDMIFNYHCNRVLRVNSEFCCSL